jgi:peptidyl-prolyl cis-trans isomerase C
MLRFDGVSARSLTILTLAASLCCASALTPVLAQVAPSSPAPAPSTPAPAAPGAPAAAPADPIIAKVNDHVIRQSDVKAAAETLPENARGMPAQVLLPMLLDQVIDGQALLISARKQGLDKDPTVSRQMSDASDRALQSALIGRQVGPTLTEDAVRARYDRDIAGKPGEEEVHARHILVADEAEAKKIIAELKKGGDFAALAKKYSTDPGGAAQGGDLGFFRQSEMVPEFATAAFAMKPGEISAEPVHTQFGWHVIKLEERRTAPPPSFEQSHDEIRQKMIQEGVTAVIAKARADVKIERFNMDGSVPKATDTATPPPAPPAPATKPAVPAAKP